MGDYRSVPFIATLVSILTAKPSGAIKVDLFGKRPQSPSTIQRAQGYYSMRWVKHVSKGPGPDYKSPLVRGSSDKLPIVR